MSVTYLLLCRKILCNIQKLKYKIIKRRYLIWDLWFQMVTESMAAVRQEGTGAVAER